MDEQYIPIDIHTNKLLDWLVSRRHCQKDWQKNILIIREKINNAIQDMPVHEGIAKLLSGSYINYFHCISIINILKETEAGSKNFFGSYSSQRMKDWLEIIKLYEKDNVYLAEASQMLIRNVTYEIPSLKKDIAKCEQLQMECDKREADCIKNGHNARGEYEKLCKQLGIEGVHVKKELVDRLSELPQLHSTLAEQIVANLPPAVEYYVELVRFVLGNQHQGGTLPLLKFIIEKGNVSTYEWIYGEPPLKIEEPHLDISIEDNDFQEDNGGIDFGENDGGAIDFGDADVELEVGEIDWGNTDSDSAIDSDSQLAEPDITLEESGIVIESSGTEGGSATGAEALSILDNPSTRETLINEVKELEAFLKIRLVDLRAPADALALSQLQDAPAIVQMQTQESITSLLGKVKGILKLLSDPTTSRLHNAKHTPRYIDHLVNELKQKLTIEEKMNQSQQLVKEKRQEYLNRVLDYKPKLKLIIEKTKELQEQIQNDISKKYKGRPVNLMGGINVI